MTAPKLVVFTDQRTGRTFTMTVPPTSAWFHLLPNVQEATIRRETPTELAEREHYRAVGGVLLQRDLEARRK